MLLGDLGADVVKVERPGGGDDTLVGESNPYVGDEVPIYLAVNRNKRSVALDLATHGPPGRTPSRRTSRRARRELQARDDGAPRDVLRGTVGSEPGTGVLLGVRFRNGWQVGLRPGYDFIVQAVGGLMSVAGPEGGEEPTKVGVAVVDVLTGLFASNAILAALLARSASGTGQRVEVDLCPACSQGAREPGVHVRHDRRGAPCARQPTSRARPTRCSRRRTGTSWWRWATTASLLRSPGRSGSSGWPPTTVSPRFSARWLIGTSSPLSSKAGCASGRRPSGWRCSKPPACPPGSSNDIGEVFALAGSLGLSPVAYVGDRGAGDEIAEVADPMRLEASRSPIGGGHPDSVSTPTRCSRARSLRAPFCAAPPTPPCRPSGRARIRWTPRDGLPGVPDGDNEARVPVQHRGRFLRALHGRRQQIGEVHRLRDTSGGVGVLFAGLWRSEPGTFEYTFATDETFLLLEGSVSIDVEGGETVDLEEGDMVSFSAGTKAVWHVHRASKKFFVVSG